MPLEGHVPPALALGAEVAFVCDDAGLVLASSATVGDLLRCPPDSLLGRPLDHLVTAEDEETVRRGLAEARRRGTSRLAVRLRAAGGPSVASDLSLWCVEEDGARRTICLLSGARARTEERARCLADTHKVIATILALALEDLALEELLRRTLDLILSVPWLSIDRKGAIFLVEGEPEALVMKASRGLHGAILASCARVSFGSCLCGEAARERRPVHHAGLDERHTTRYPGIVPHGHYCVPICSESATLGVLTTYLAPGHERADIELEFLSAVANTLAGVLIRRRADAERERAEVASQAKSEFLALVSHELLTPVTAVMLGCERLERDRVTPLAPRHLEVVSRMEGALGRLASTIRMLLEHARLDSGGPALRVAPVDLAAVAMEIVEEVRPVAERKGLAVRLALEAPLPALRTDERLLKIVLANLAANAVKFTRSGTVSVNVAYRDGAHRVAVEDTGPGIPPGERDRIFDGFEPLEPLANKHVPGMGLGLALARRLASALGASLELEPERGPGSTFVVTLPAHLEAPPHAALH